MTLDLHGADSMLLARIAELEGAVDPFSVAAQVLDEFRDYLITPESTILVMARISELVRDEC